MSDDTVISVSGVCAGRVQAAKGFARPAERGRYRFFNNRSPLAVISALAGR